MWPLPLSFFPAFYGELEVLSAQYRSGIGYLLGLWLLELSGSDDLGEGLTLSTARFIVLKARKRAKPLGKSLGKKQAI